MPGAVSVFDVAISSRMFTFPVLLHDIQWICSNKRDSDIVFLMYAVTYGARVSVKYSAKSHKLNATTQGRIFLLKTDRGGHKLDAPLQRPRFASVHYWGTFPVRVTAIGWGLRRQPTVFSPVYEGTEKYSSTFQCMHRRENIIKGDVCNIVSPAVSQCVRFTKKKEKKQKQTKRQTANYGLDSGWRNTVISHWPVKPQLLHIHTHTQWAVNNQAVSYSDSTTHQNTACFQFQWSKQVEMSECMYVWRGGRGGKKKFASYEHF